MKAYVGVDVYIHVFLTSALVVGSHPCHFTPESWSGLYREVKILEPTGTRTLNPLSSSPQAVAIPTALLELINPPQVSKQLCRSHNTFVTICNTLYC
jgi:hypothetical protein